MQSRFLEEFHFTKRGTSLRTLLIYPFVILIVVAVISTGFLSLYNSGKAAEYMAWQLMGEIAARIEDRVSTFLYKAHLVNEINANTIESGQIDLNNMKEQELHFWHQVKSFDYISYSYIGRADGGFFGARRLADGTLQTIATETLTGGKILYFDTDSRGLPTTISSSLPYYDHKTRPWYKAGIEAGKPAWSPVFIDAGGEGLTITAATPLYDNSKTIIGVLGCSFIFSHINQFLHTLKIGESGLTFIIERSGMLVATSTLDATYTADKKRVASLESENPKINQTGKSISEQFGDLSKIDQQQRLSIHVQGERYFVHLSPLTDHLGIDWLIVVIIPENDFMSHIKAGNFNTVLLSLLALGVTVVVGFAIARRITKPILELNIAARSLADGEWSHELKIERRDEVGELARSFNLMVKNLQTTTVSRDRLAEEIEERKKIESELQKLAAVVEHSSEFVNLAALDGKMIFLNEAGGIMVGIPPHDVENYSIMEAIPDELKSIVEKDVLPAVLKEGRWEGELQYRNLITGTLTDVHAMIFSIRNSDGEPLYLANVSLDITERNRTEEALEESKRRLSEIIDFAPDATFAIDKDGKVIAWNRAIEEMTGVKASDMLGKGNYEYSLPFYGVRRPILIDLIFISDEEIKSKYHFVSKEGEIIIAEADVPIRGKNQALWGKACPLYDNKGNVAGAIESIRDITERKLAEGAILRAKEDWERTFDAVPDLIAILDNEYRIVRANKAMATKLSMTAEKCTGLMCYHVVHGTNEPPSLCPHRQLLVDGFEHTTEVHEDRLGGDFVVSVSPLLGQEGKLIGSVHVARDITGRKRAEEALRESEQKYRAVIENMQDVFYRTDREGNLVLLSPSGARLLGLDSPEPSYGMNVARDFYAIPEERNRLLQALKANGEVSDYDVTLRRHDGSLMFVSTNSHIYRDTNGEPLGVEGVFRDITQRKRAEEALRETTGTLQTLIQASPVAIIALDPDGYVKLWNPAAERLFGWRETEVLGQFLPFVSDDKREEHCTLRERMLRGEAFTAVEVRRQKKDGSPVDISLSTALMRDAEDNITGIISVNIDITEHKRAEQERKTLEERLQRAEKMEALGTLAGGVAHDLNNVLGIVVGYSELLLDKINEPSPLKSYVKAILKGGEKAAAIVQDLLTLTRRGVPNRHVLNLNSIVVDCQESPEFAKLSSYHPNVLIRSNLDPDLMNMSGSAVHLGKSFMNLVSNAAEATPNAGVITIKTANQYLDKPVSGYDEFREGDYVVLSVSDTGEGIAAADLKRIFEPFYTKKVMGRSGTGLGLAVVWGTVKDHQGYIDVESEEGKGTTFTLYFPVTREEISPEQVSVSASEYMGNGESILVVDDIEGQRDLATQMLMKLNYKIVSVSSGEEAVEYMQRHAVDVIVLDMIMDPGVDGLDTYTKILELHPDQKAIIVSGFSETERVSKTQELGAGAYVKKPYVLEKLGLAVRKELDRRV